MGAKITGYQPWVDFRKNGDQVRMIKVLYTTDEGIEDDVDVEKNGATPAIIEAAIKEDMKAFAGLIGKKI